MDSQIRVGTGVRVNFEKDAGFATGCVSSVTDFLDGFVSVLWHYWRMPDGSYKADEPELISKFFVEELVVMSQPDHDYNPLREKSAGFMLWFRLERYDDFLARWQGAPANPWID
jgi:hypothetical protein